MTWATVLIFIFVAFLACLYFLPYKKLKGKIFRKLLPASFSPETVSYKGKDFSVVFERRGSLWYMSAPVAWQADTAKMRRLILRLSELDVEERLSGKNPEDPLYSIGRNGSLELGGDGSAAVLRFGGFNEAGDGVYITKSGDKDILSVNASVISLLPKDENDFKRTLLFEETYSNICYAEAVMEGKGYLMTKTDSGWIVNGKNVFDEKVQPFIEGLLDIRAESFADSGIKLPAKHDGLITIKATKKAASRYFFTMPEYEGRYLVPMNGEILIVPKDAVKRFFEF